MDPSDTQENPRPAVRSQLSTNLPGINTFVTTHDPETGKSVIHSSREGNWQHYNDNAMAMYAIYAVPHDATFEDDKDLMDSDELIASKNLGLVREQGNVTRYVDISPGFSSIMHRTVSADIGVVLEGTVELHLDDGSITLLRRGDTAIQRGTMHAWRNPSQDQWARMLFILQSTQPLTVGGKQLGEDIGDASGIPASNAHA